MDDNKVNLFLSIMAYTQGGWTADDVIKAYEFIYKEALKAVPEGKVRLFKAAEQETH